MFVCSTSKLNRICHRNKNKRTPEALKHQQSTMQTRACETCITVPKTHYLSIFNEIFYMFFSTLILFNFYVPFDFWYFCCPIRSLAIAFVQKGKPIFSIFDTPYTVHGHTRYLLIVDCQRSRF